MKLSIRHAVIGLVTVLVIAVAVPAAATVAFALRGKQSQVVVWSYDAPVDHAAVVLNRRGVVKRALVDEGAEPVSWVSGYGSVTLNQIGADFPVAGINQAGLVVVALPLADARYAARSHRAEISPLQWVQYCLDSFENVKQVVFSAEQYRIDGPVGYHFLACDVFGTCATVEPVGGEIQSRAGDKLPLAILTTRTFDAAIDYLNVSLGYAGSVTATGTDAVLDRFVTTVDKVNVARGRKTPTPVEDGLAIVRAIEGGSSDFRVVFEPEGRQLRLDLGDEPWVIRLKDFGFECREPERALIVPPRPEKAAVEAFGAPDSAAIRNLASATAAAADGLDAALVARTVKYAEDYHCSELPPIKQPADPAAAAVD